MNDSPSLRFAWTVQALGLAGRELGLEVPSFRSPPRLVGVQRSIRRAAGSTTVAVVVRGRPWAAVQADMVEGLLAANRLDPTTADRARAHLWSSLEPHPAASPEARPEGEARSARPAA